MPELLVEFITSLDGYGLTLPSPRARPPPKRASG